MKRSEIMSKIIGTISMSDTSEVEEAIDDVIDDIEADIIEAYNHLDSINGIGDLSSVEDCHKVLETLKEDLY